MQVSNNCLISKEKMRGFLDHLGKEYKLAGPVDTGKVIEYRETSAFEILMDDRVSYNSIKSFYFPQTELMFTFENEDVKDNIEIPGYVIFGARPCDLEALRVMSIVYTTGKYADPFFQRRFDANILIGVGCKNQKPECFCQEMNIDKEFSDFCDIMLVDNDDSYLIKFLSEKGKVALYDYERQSKQSDRDSLFTEFTQTDSPDDTADDNAKELSPCFSGTDEPSPCPGSGTDEPSPCPIILDVGKNDADYFDIIDWAKVSEACKGCGICTYVCPTCYCFDFKDVSRKGMAERYKCWDSCMYPRFTLHASGHNPREYRYERYRQRVLHKYKYVPANFDGNVACTGCGRCVRGCPVGINIKDIVKQIIRKAES